MISLPKLEPGLKEAKSESPGDKLGVETSKCTDLVLYEAHQSKKQDTSPLKIFSRILSKKDSDESDTAAFSSLNKTASSSTTKPSKRQDAHMFVPKPDLKRHVCFSRQESNWLALALAQPVEEDCLHMCFHCRVGCVLTIVLHVWT